MRGTVNLSDYSSLAEAITACGTDWVRLVCDVPSELTADLEVPVGVTVAVEPGCLISGPRVLTMTGGIEDCLHQIFGEDVDVTGPFVRAAGIRPEWFGSFPDNVDKTGAFARALAFAVSTKGGIPLRLSGNATVNSRYKITDTLVTKNRVTVVGTSLKSCQILFVPPDKRPCFHLASDGCDETLFQDFGIVGGAGYVGTGIKVGDVGESASRCCFNRILVSQLNVGIDFALGISQEARTCHFNRNNTNLKVSGFGQFTIDNPIMEGWSDYGFDIDTGVVEIRGGTVEGGGVIGSGPGCAIRATGGSVHLKGCTWFEDNTVDFDIDGAAIFTMEDCTHSAPASFDNVKRLHIRTSADFNALAYKRFRVSSGVRVKDIEITYTRDTHGARLWVDNVLDSPTAKPRLYEHNFDGFGENGWNVLAPQLVWRATDPELQVSSEQTHFLDGTEALKVELVGDGSVFRYMTWELDKTLLASLKWRDLFLVMRMGENLATGGKFYRRLEFHTSSGYALSFNCEIAESVLESEPDDWFWAHVLVSLAEVGFAAEDIESVKFKLGLMGTGSVVWIDSIALVPGSGIVLP